MLRFYWLIEGSIAGSSRPGAHGSGRLQDTAAREQLDRDLLWLRERGIGAVLSLTEEPLAADCLNRHGFEVHHLPIPDMTAPGPQQFIEALEFVDLQRSAGRSVVVHCLMGQGRTASILAAYLIRNGMGPEDAVAQLRALCPGALPAPDQESALHRFAQRADWIV